MHGASRAVACACLVALACGPDRAAHDAPVPRAASSQPAWLVVDPGGALTEEYAYDGAGNLTRVTSTEAPAPPSISGFAPSRGIEGQVVTVTGAGFSPSTVSNTVQVGGVAAPVLYAESKQLRFAVPSGARTGRISVTTGASTATSGQDFVVVPPVSISDFTPKSGGPGTVITVYGAGFDPTPGENAVTVGGIAATVNGGGAGHLTATLAADGASGKVQVRTSSSEATSSQDFLVLPGEVSQADVAFSRHANVGEAVSVQIATAGKLGMLLVDAQAGDHLTLYAAGITFPGSTKVIVYDPAGGVVMTKALAVGQNAKHTLPKLARAGTYRVVVQPAATSTGAASLTVFRDVAIALDVRGPSVPVTLLPGQNGRCEFVGAAGDRLSLAFPELTRTPSGATVALRLYDRDENPAGMLSASGPGSWQIPQLDAQGRHTITVEPSGTAGLVGSFVLSAPIAGKLVADGPVVRFQTSRHGQAGRYTFDAAAGQNLTLRATAGAGFLKPLDVSVEQLDGTTVRFLKLSSNDDAKLDLSAFPVTGTYVASVQPSGLDLGPVDLQLLRQDEGPVLVDGAPRGIAISAGRNGRYTFDGRAGDFIGIGFSALATTPSVVVDVKVLAPSGAVVATVSLSGSGALQTPALREDGTYAISVAPRDTAAATASLFVSHALTGRLVAGAAPLRFQPDRPGQPGRYAFDAVAGESYSLRVTTGSSFASGVEIKVLDPSGRSELTTIVSKSTDTKRDLTSLAVTGTYTVVATPLKGETGTIDLHLLRPVVTPIEIGGPPVAIAVASAQNGEVTFSGAAADQLSLGFPAFSTIPAGGAANLTLSDSSGAVLGSVSIGTSGSWQLPPLPATGQYRIAFKPGSTAAASITLLLSRSLAGALSTNGDAFVHQTARVGQAGRYSFVANAGQAFTVRATVGPSYATGATIAVLPPNGSALATATVSGGTEGKLDLGVLSASGEHVVTVTPSGVGTGSVTLRVIPQALDVLTIGAAPRPLSLVAGQNGRYRFEASAGDALDLVIGSVSASPAGGSFTIKLYRPDGTVLQSSTFTGAKTWSLSQLASTGTYTLTVSPPGTAAGSFTLQLTRR